MEGEDLCLPALGETLTRHDYSLFRTDNLFEKVFEDKFENIKQEGDLLYLSNLKIGSYAFFYIKFRELKKVTINVRKGSRWNISPLYVIQPTNAIRLVDQSNYLTYSQLKVEGTEVSFNVICNDIESVRVHALGYHYFPNKVSRMALELRENCASEKRETFPIHQNYNSYFSEKELSDEVKYVLERKTRSTFMGNTLEKPTGFLKREFNRKCQTDNQGINQEAAYKVV